MSLGGSKNGGNELWGGRKWSENGRKSQTFWLFTVAAAAASPARPAAVRREIPPEGSSGCCAPSRPARVTGGWLVVPRLVQSLTALQ